MSLSSKEVGLSSFALQDRPPVAIPFFAFRIMVACGFVMLGLAWLGSYLAIKHRLERSRMLLWRIFLGFPLPWIAILTGLVYRGGWPPAMDHLRRDADGGCPFSC